MLTKSEALALRHGQNLFSGIANDRQGNPVKCRVNGKCQTLKLTPAFFKLPVKHGLRNCFYISLDNMNDWFTSEDDAKAAIVEGSPRKTA